MAVRQNNMVLSFRKAWGYELTTDDRAEGAARVGPGAGPRLPAEAVGAVAVAVVVEAVAAAGVANHDQAYVVHDGAAAEVAAGAGAGAAGAGGRSASSTIVSAMLPSGLDAASAVKRRKGAAGWPGKSVQGRQTKSAGEKRKMPLTRAASASSRSLPLLRVRPPLVRLRRLGAS